jgi:hypothetical protein
MAKAIGFQGDYNSEDFPEWLSGTAKGFGREWESNWIELWATICVMYMEMVEGAGGV